LLCFLSMVLTALPVFSNCVEKTMLREKNQYSIVFCFFFFFFFLLKPHPDRKLSFILCNTFVILG
jgi:hypothetical protein